MKSYLTKISFVLVLALFISFTNAIMTEKQLLKKAIIIDSEDVLKMQNRMENLGMNVTTQCNKVDLSAEYNYSGIVRSGYLSIGYGGSALNFMFYGKSDIKDQSQLKTVPTIIWLNGGPGHSSQVGNLKEIGPLTLKRKLNVEVVMNEYSWVKKYNVLFVDQPVGTGLSYADLSSSRPFATSLDGKIFHNLRHRQRLLLRIEPTLQHYGWLFQFQKPRYSCYITIVHCRRRIWRQVCPSYRQKNYR